MAKDVIITTSRINSFGTRVLTSGVDIEQYKRNPILLYMHERGRVIGRIDNLRFDGDRLIGTPVFDIDDDFAATIGRKWVNGFLNMCSGGFEPVELSSDPQHLLPGQRRPTVMRSILVEVSIADLGSNDDALKLYQPDGKLLQLAAGEDNPIIPLLETTENNNHNKTNLEMNRILLTLGLPVAATEEDAINSIAALQGAAKRADTIELARITGAVDAAIKANKTTADKRDHLLALGKAAGFESLQATLDMLSPTAKPTDFINRVGDLAASPAMTLAYGQMSEEQLLDLRANNRPEYIRLYRAEFGIAPQFE